ncbi:MAG: hypothetical protein HQL92_03545 [Magnetococcales bacterium]|nr:hypothetical protein [Magnetococcales bacterium]
MIPENTEKKQTCGRFQKGQSGNPRGRPSGVTRKLSLRMLLEPHGQQLIETAVRLALSGDVGALKLCLDRLVPSFRPTEQATSFSLPEGGFADQGRSILEAIAAGTLTPGEGTQILSGIGTLARVVETDELTRRIEALERND